MAPCVPASTFAALSPGSLLSPRAASTKVLRILLRRDSTVKAFLMSSSPLVAQHRGQDGNFFREWIPLTIPWFMTLSHWVLPQFSRAHKARKDYSPSSALASWWGCQMSVYRNWHTLISGLGSTFYCRTPQNKIEVHFRTSQSKVQRWSTQGCFGDSTIIRGSGSFRPSTCSVIPDHGVFSRGLKSQRWLSVPSHHDCIPLSRKGMALFLHGDFQEFICIFPNIYPAKLSPHGHASSTRVWGNMGFILYQKKSGVVLLEERITDMRGGW